MTSLPVGFVNRRRWKIRVDGAGFIRRVFFLSTCVIAGLTWVGRSESLVIDFESFNLGGAPYLNTSETLVFTNVGGSGITVTIQGNDDVRIYDMWQFGSQNPAATGQALIDMNWSNYNNPLGTTIHFDLCVRNVSLRAGDFGSDDDSPIEIVAYDGDDNMIGSASTLWEATAGPPFALLAVNVAGIKKVHYLSGGSYKNSTFIDDIAFEEDLSSSAEPATWGRVKRLYR